MYQFKILMVTVLAITALTADSFAFFDNGNLTAVFYNNSENGSKGTLALNLGSLNLLDITQTQVLRPAGSIYDGNLFNSDSFYDLKMAFYGYTSDDVLSEWFATTSTDGPKTAEYAIGAFRHASDQLSKSFRTSGTDRFVSADATLFDLSMHSGFSKEGSFAGYNYSWREGVGMAASDFVDMYLYKFTNVGTIRGVLSPGSNGDYQATLRISADGSIILNPDFIAAVPVPSGLLLFSSGLLILFKSRRSISG